MSRFEVQFGRDAFAPGDTIEGAIVAAKRVKGRGIKAELCYVDESPDYLEQVTHATAGSLKHGSLEPGTEIPFALQLPPTALPNWDPAGTARRLAGQQPIAAADDDLASYGQLYWAVAVRVRRRLWGEAVEHHPVPVSDDRSVWGGAQPAETRREVDATVKGWDVAIAPDRRWARRGEELTADVTIGEPASDRGGLRAGLVCEASYDVETTTVTGPGQTTTQRETKTATAHEEWTPLDPSAPMQQVGLRVPEDAPFSYEKDSPLRAGPPGVRTRKKGKSALAFEWRVVAREDKRLRRDPRREVPLQVLP